MEILGVLEGVGVGFGVGSRVLGKDLLELGGFWCRLEGTKTHGGIFPRIPHSSRG